MNFFSLILLTLFSSAVFASGGAGNGGGVHACPDRAEQELYDVYEGKVRYGLTFYELLGFQETLEYALWKVERVSPRLALRLRSELIAVLADEKQKVLPALELPVIKDATILLLGKGCSYKQLGNWDDVTGTIFIDGELLIQLNPFHQAAFYLHEAVYKLDRVQNGATNSDQARRVVAEILANSYAMPHLRLIWQKADGKLEGSR